jgi:hypothetical protein
MRAGREMKETFLRGSRALGLVVDVKIPFFQYKETFFVRGDEISCAEEEPASQGRVLALLRNGQRSKILIHFLTNRGGGGQGLYRRKWSWWRNWCSGLWKSCRITSWGFIRLIGRTWCHGFDGNIVTYSGVERLLHPTTAATKTTKAHCHATETSWLGPPRVGR